MVPVEVLRSFPYFAGVSAESLKALAAIADEHAFTAGQTLFREGDPAKCLHIVRKGQIDILYQLPDGEECVVDTVIAGELMGWSALIEPHENTATGVARDAGALVCLEAAGIRRLCEHDPVLGYRLLKQIAKVLASRLQGARVRLAAGD